MIIQVEQFECPLLAAGHQCVPVLQTTTIAPAREKSRTNQKKLGQSVEQAENHKKPTLVVGWQLRYQPI